MIRTPPGPVVHTLPAVSIFEAIGTFGVTRTEHIEAWFAEMARSEGISVEAVIKREAGDPAAIRRMLEAEEVATASCSSPPNAPAV
jgi:hypothetical protein